MENQDIDKMFSEAGKSAEEKPTFPNFEKVWNDVEEKLDKKEPKRRIIPLWLPYGIAAGLALTLGILYFMNDDKVKIEPQITSNDFGKPINPKLNESSKKVEEINKTFEQNIKREPDISSPNAEGIIAYQTPTAQKYYKDESSNITKFSPPVITKSLETAYGIENNYIYDSEKTQDIEGVVVTAMGSKKQKMSVGYATTTVTSESLSGKIAGVKISPSKGSFGTSSKMKVRSKYSSGDHSKDIEEVVMLNNKKSLWQKLFKNSKKETPIIEVETDLPDAGKLTAGEVNDFSKWDYWQDFAVPILDQYRKTWKFFPDKRVSVQLVNFDNNPIIGKELKLINDKKEIIWESVTDNRGSAELWISSLLDQPVNSQQYSIIDGQGNVLAANAKEFRNGQNLIKINENCLKKRALELVFVVDATGSMGDEINYLKSELLDVLKKVESNLKNTNVRYGSVFYRDLGDEYVTKKFDFSNDAENLIQFIKNQQADGGGDTPEAVVEALETSIDELAWSKENSTKLMFLLLDAPPHLSNENIGKLNQKIQLASKKGITIIPIAASDTDKQTEYLMRTFALLTNGTYTFLTNESGIGNNHIKPTASEYEVEKLNDLLLRLILQRSTVPDCKNGVTTEYINKKLETESIDKKDFATKIYPNPTKGVFKIDTKRDIEEFVLFDYTGKILMKKNNLAKGSNTFDISAYPQSVYLVRLKYGTESETFKIIKK